MPWCCMKALANSLELSSRAAARVGPKILSPASWNASTTPSASGASGPTTVNATASLRASSIHSGIDAAGALIRPSSRAVPALPGATSTREIRGERASFHASACSRPPEPMTRSFMLRGVGSVPEVAEAGEYHGDAVLVRGGDHLVVAQAAPGLDDCACPRLRHDVHAIAEGKERIGRNHRSLQREACVPGLDGGDTRRVHAAHLPGAYPKRPSAAAKHDRVRLDEPRDAPGEHEIR